jgi:alpha-mannosidase
MLQGNHDHRPAHGRRGSVAMLLCLASLLLLAGFGVGTAADLRAEPRLTVVTASAHCDWTWGHSRAWHAERYAGIIRDVLLLMRKYPHYVWQLENVNEELAPFLQKAKRDWPELIPEFWQRVCEGRIEVIVAISNPRLCEVYPETTVRNLVLGKQYFRRQAPGLQQPVYHAVDLMVGHSQMPQLLSQADYQYFLFSRPCNQKRVFWRTGLDGTRMLCALQHYGYAGLTANGVALESHSGDDALPAEALAQAAAAWNPSQRVLTTSARFFREVEQAGSPLPELKGVLDSLESFCCGTGLHGNQNLYTWNNQLEDLLLTLEKAQAMASIGRARRTDEAAAAPPLDQLWRELLSCVGHAILWSWKPDYEERLDQSRRTRAAAERLLAEALSSVAREIRFRVGAGAPLVVFNFHAWPVTGPIEFVYEGDLGGLALRDGSGHDVPWQVLPGAAEAGRRLLAFVAPDVPACGYKTFYLSRVASLSPDPSGVRAGSAPIENEFYRLQLAADGQLQVWDKQREMKLGSDAAGLGELVLYDTPQPTDWMMNGPLGARHGWEPQAAEFAVTSGPVWSSLKTAGRFGPHTARREVRLWRGSRRIEFLVDIDAAAGCGVFFLRCPLGRPGRVFAGIPFGAEPREHFDQEPFRGEYFAQGYPDAFYATRWTDVSTNDGGCTLIAPHGMHNGYAYRRQEQALEFALLRVRPLPQGIWGQVHPSLQGTGQHRWRCALVPHAGTWREAATYRDAWELHTPLLAFSPSRGVGHAELSGQPPSSAGQRDDVAALVEVQPANVVLSSWRCPEPAVGERAPPWELRLYETTGQTTDVAVRLAVPIARVEATNLLGEPVPAPEQLAVAGPHLGFRLPPWKIITLRVTPQQ